MTPRIGLALGLALAAGRGWAVTWMLSSPDRRCAIAVTLSTDGSLQCSAQRDGKTAIGASPLGLRRDDQDFTAGLRPTGAGGTARTRERYELFSGPAAQVDHAVNRRTLRFANADGAPLELDLAASDEGVAFRYRFPDRSDDVEVIRREATGFAVPAGSRAWLQPYHPPGPFTPAYEDFYQQATVGAAPSRFPPDGSRGPAFPALFDVVPAETWVLLTESGTDGGYPACHLNAGPSGTGFGIAFPAPGEGRLGQPPPGPAEPRHALPWTTPWRVIVLGGTAGAIATSTLVTDLAPPSRVTDTSWIRPGRVALAGGWWPHHPPVHAAADYDAFTDFAAEMGWEYSLFDEGWWEAGLDRIARHARARGVRPEIWTTAERFYDPAARRKKLDEWRSAGVRAVKVDYWLSDRQETMAVIEGLLADAAARRLAVNLHGVTVPRGWQRTWPNLLTIEGVFGEEYYVQDRRFREGAAEHHAILPFTRNAVGPMDVMPVGCSSPYLRTTTAAHELAWALVATSGLVHYASEPAFFRSLPAPVRKLLRDAPARWDESRCLSGDPGRLVVMARRAGASWFVAGLNGTAGPLPVEVDLAPFRRYGRRVAVVEGADVGREVAVEPVSAADAWRREVPPRGGFILRLER